MVNVEGMLTLIRLTPLIDLDLLVCSSLKQEFTMLVTLRRSIPAPSRTYRVQLVNMPD